MSIFKGDFRLGRGTACVYYMKHSLSQVVIAPNDKRITSLYTAFKKRHITPKIFSSLNQKKIPLHYELPVYEREKGRFSYPEDIQQLTFLKTHLIQVNTSTGSIQFVPFAIRWQAPEGDVHVTRKRTKEFYRNMEKKIEEAIMVHLIEVVNSTYKRIILLLRKEFPTLLIDEIRRILERLVNKRSVVHRIGHEKYEGTMFKVGDGVTTAIIRRVQEKLARRRAEAVIIDINLGQKRGNPANSSVQRGRGSAAGTSQSRMNTRGNQTPEPVITSLHNLTGNQLSIEIGHPADLNQKEDLKWSSWSIMDSGKVDNSQSSSAPMEDAMACNQSTVAGPDSPGNSSITSEEIAPDAGFLDDFPDDIFEQSSEVGMNNLHYVESSGNWPQPIGQEGFSQPFWALPDGQGEEGREEPIDLEQEIIVVDPQEQKKEPTFKVPKGRAPRRKRTITENGKPESSKRPKDIEMEHDDDFFGDI